MELPVWRFLFHTFDHVVLSNPRPRHTHSRFADEAMYAYQLRRLSWHSAMMLDPTITPEDLILVYDLP